MVQVPRRAEFADVNTSELKQVTDSLTQQFGGDLSSSMKEQQDEVNRRVKALGGQDTTVTLDKPVQLGSFFSKNRMSPDSA